MRASAAPARASQGSHPQLNTLHPGSEAYPVNRDDSAPTGAWRLCQPAACSKGLKQQHIFDGKGRLWWTVGLCLLTEGRDWVGGRCEGTTQGRQCIFSTPVGCTVNWPVSRLFVSKTPFMVLFHGPYESTSTTNRTSDNNTLQMFQGCCFIIIIISFRF